MGEIVQRLMRSVPALRSLRLRIFLAVLAWATMGIGGIWYSATRLFAKHVEQQYHEELDVHIRELAGLVSIGADGRLRMDRPLSDPRYMVPLSGFYWQVTQDGGGRLRSPSLTRGRLDESVAHDSSIHHHVKVGPTGPTITYGIMRRARSGADVHFAIATDRRFLDQTIAEFTRELVAWLTLLAAALLATGWAVTLLGLRPLHRLARATTRLRNGQAARLEGSYPTEIAPLVADLNAFIEHNAGIVERARVEAGNLAHALRTPLAIITDEAERLASTPETRGASQVLLAQGEAMVRQIEFQLARARSAVGARGPATVSRMAEIMPPILSAMRRLHPDQRFQADLSALDGAVLPVDPVDLSELIAILIDNAGKWGRHRVDVLAAHLADAWLVRIVDDGPGLTPEQASRAFDIGARFDPATPGYGLGLAIARDIAAAYGIKIELCTRSDGLAGLEARLSIPAIQDDMRRR